MMDKNHSRKKRVRKSIVIPLFFLYKYLSFSRSFSALMRRKTLFKIRESDSLPFSLLGLRVSFPRRVSSSVPDGTERTEVGKDRRLAVKDASADGEQGRGETRRRHTTGQGCCLHPHLDGLEAARYHGGASETSTNTHHHAISNPTSLSTTVRTSNHPTKASPSQAVSHDEGPATILVSWGGCLSVATVSRFLAA